MKTNVSLLTLLLFIINVGINLSLYFKFTDKEDLFAQFHTVTIDQLVVIGYKLTNNPPDSLVQELYHLDKYKIKLLKVNYHANDFIESNKENIGFVFEDQEIYNKLKDLINKKCCRMIKTTSIIQN